MESSNEQERYLTNPFRLLRCAIELGGMGVKAGLAGLVRRVDDALDVDFDPSLRIFPTVVEAPVATEEELMYDPDR